MVPEPVRRTKRDVEDVSGRVGGGVAEGGGERIVYQRVR